MCVFPSKEEGVQISHFLKSTLLKAGFVPGKSKCQWEPVRVLKWLGFSWDLDKGSVSVPPDKIRKVLALITDTIKIRHVTARQLASVTGKIISNMLVFGKNTTIMTKQLHAVIDTRMGWDCKVRVTLEAVKELEFWASNIESMNSRSFVFPPKLPQVIVYSDASSVGCGSHVSLNKNLVAHRNFTDLEMSQSSTWRELISVQFSLDSFSSFIAGAHVKLYTDNKAVSHIVESGSNKLHLNNIAKNIYLFTKKNNIQLSVDWIPRSQNEQADYISKIVDFEDWVVADSFFAIANFRWGPFTLDCFASSSNSKTPRFFSKFFNPGSLGVDAFAHSWHSENCWLVPPVSLIPEVIVHAITCKAKATLVVPYWPSAVFWPYIIEWDGCFRPFIIDCFYTLAGNEVFRHGNNTNSVFGSEQFNSPVLFLRLDCSFSFSWV